MAVATLAMVAAVGAAGCGGSSNEGGNSEGADRDGISEDASAPEALLRGLAPEADGSLPSVVTLRPAGDGDAAVVSQAPSSVRAEPAIDQFGLQFSPTRLTVDVGVPLVFTNSEGALAHNVLVRTIDAGESLFDEDANAGDELRLTLEAEGGYDILCDMHPGMTAFVFATSDPYVVMAESDGTFSFPGVPAGTYELRLWTAASGFSDAMDITVSVAGTDVDLRATKN